MWNNRNLGECLLQIYFCFLFFLFFCILNHRYFFQQLLFLQYSNYFEVYFRTKKKRFFEATYSSNRMVVTREETRCLKRSISSSDYLTSSGSGFPQFASQLQDLCCQLEDLHFLCPSTVECAAISTIQRNDLRMFHNCRSTYPSGMKQNSLHLIYKP